MIVDQKILFVQDDDEVIAFGYFREPFLLCLLQREKTRLNFTDVDFDLIRGDGKYCCQHSAISFE